jgi:membrane protein YdbS with pleckstrin-like domain
VTPVPVDGLLSGTQLNEGSFFVVLGLIPLIRAVFVGVPVVIVLVALVVVTLVVLAFSIVVVPNRLAGWQPPSAQQVRLGQQS